MSSIRRQLAFVGTALLLFVALRAVGSTGFYPPLFRAAMSPLLRSLGSNRFATLERFDGENGRFDTRLSMGSTASGPPGFTQDLLLDTVRAEYVPTALVVALVLATPLAWRRKWKALLTGLFLVHLFIAFRFLILTMYGFSQAGLDGHHLLELGSTARAALTLSDIILRSDFHLTYVVAIVIWLFVTRVGGRFLPFLSSAPPHESSAFASGGAAS